MNHFINKTEYLEEVYVITFGNKLKVKPWEYICAKQITKAVFDNDNESLIKEIQSNEVWIEYATMVLSQDNLRKEFEFLMRQFFKNLKEIK